jgi:hypothetical protein
MKTLFFAAIKAARRGARRKALISAHSFYSVVYSVLSFALGADECTVCGSDSVRRLLPDGCFLVFGVSHKV